jgi:NADH dehydrogenase/NADH:ubiquinone oxidoreductase subunit G
MKITYDGNIYDFEKGITLLEISISLKININLIL